MYNQTQQDVKHGWDMLFAEIVWIMEKLDNLQKKQFGLTEQSAIDKLKNKSVE